MRKFLSILAISAFSTTAFTSNGLNFNNTSLIQNTTNLKLAKDITFDVYYNFMNPNLIQESLGGTLKDILKIEHFKDLEKIIAKQDDKVIPLSTYIQTSLETVGKVFQNYTIIDNLDQFALHIRDNRKVANFEGLHASDDFERPSGSNYHSFLSKFNEEVVQTLKEYPGLPSDAVLSNISTTFNTHYDDGRYADGQTFKKGMLTKDNELGKFFYAILNGGKLLDIHVDNIVYFFSGDVVHYWIKYLDFSDTETIDWICNKNYGYYTGVGASWQVSIDSFSYFVL